jgi:hypothetical protein
MTSAEKREATISLAAAIAKELGAPWTYTRPTDPDTYVYIVGENGARIYVALSGSYDNPDRVEISGYLNIGRNRQYVNVYEKSASGGWDRASVPSISVALKRGPEAITKEIQRRFLPEYLRIFALALAQLQKDNERDTRVLDNLKRLGKIVNAHVKEDRDNGHGYIEEQRTSVSIGYINVYGTITVSSDTATLELRSLTIEQAERVLKALTDK